MIEMKRIMNEIRKGSGHFKVKDGKLLFTREAERRVFFVMTMIMLLAGLLVKLGFF